MYAIIQSGSKQYRVQPGEVICVELLQGETGSEVVFNEVVLLGGETPQVGRPFVTGCVVRGTLLGLEKGEKVINYKYKKRKHFHRKRGHRQTYSKIKINSIGS
jgi:large subunit ribosomal protein L21